MRRCASKRDVACCRSQPTCGSSTRGSKVSKNRTRNSSETRNPRRIFRVEIGGLNSADFPPAKSALNMKFTTPWNIGITGETTVELSMANDAEAREVAKHLERKG